MSQVLEFSVRTSTGDTLDDVRKAVESAFNLKFSEGEYDFVPAYVSNILGMTIGLFQWGDDYLLETTIEDLRFLDAAQKEPLEPVRVSESVANMLSIVGPYKWRVAAPEDVARDRAFGEDLDKEMTEDAAPPPWADDI